VANRSGTKFCYVFASDKAEPREVQPGTFNENFIEIVSGLQPGEKVSLNPPRWTQTDQPAKNGEDKDNHKPETQPAEL
jgi:multidrug efflux pump subunit AcrA (membrane-fusion protein)